ncbi:MAG: glycosyltransferase family 4 protein [Chitinophagaceae bacterium]|nr:glycosyltransferase family 4 protein [Chitinophagaceae bacterium]
MNSIVFDCERMKYPDTGLYHYCLNLSRALQRHADPEKEKLCCYLPPAARFTSPAGTTVLPQHPLHKYRMPDLSGHRIWHATYQNTNYMPLRDRRIKVVLSIHDLNFLYDEKKSAAKKARYLRHLQRMVDRSDALVCISAFSKKDVQLHCHTGNKPLLVIHNGSNMLQPPALLEKSYRPRRPFLFSIGVLHRKKNYHVLLPLLRNTPLELLIAGCHEDESYIHFIREQSRMLGVSDRLHLLGRISETEKSWYFNNCNAFAFPSLSEGFGLPVVEAMSCGKPLFLSDRTALPEIGGEVSFYFRDFSPDHMQEVFRNGMQAYHSGDLAARIQARSYRFSWEKAAKQYLALYRSLYEENSGQ